MLRLSRRGPVGLLITLALLLAACGPRAQAPGTTDNAAPLLSGAQPSVPLAQAQPASAGSLPGRILFVQNADLWLWQDGAARQFTTGETWRQPAWSPDGSKFAYVLQGTNFSDIALSDTSGDSQLRLTRSQSSILEDNFWNQRPTWSPDGTQLVFVSDRSTQFPTLWIMNADGTNAHPLATPGLQLDSVDAVSWAPDGSKLAVTAYPGQGTTQIATVPLSSSSTATRVVGKLITNYPNGAVDPAFSPDGNWLAYAARDGGGVAIFVARADGTNPVRLTNGADIARAPTWSPDGQHLAYLSAKGGTVDLWVQDVSTVDGSVRASNERQLTQNMGLDGQSGLSWSR